MKPKRYVDPSDVSAVIRDGQSATGAVTAAVASSQAGGVAIANQITRVTTSATAGDSLTLPRAYAGDMRIVFNKAAANSIDIFPYSGDKINALSADAAYALAVTKGVIFVCAVDGTWDTILTA